MSITLRRAIAAAICAGLCAAAGAQSAADAPTAVPGHDTSRWGPNIAAHSETNFIDPTVHTSTISGGGYHGRAQQIGSSLLDPTYVPGGARIATIGGGYDNTNNQLAGTIAGGAHHFLAGAGDHGTVGGGSWNTIEDGSYSTISGGTYNTINGTNSVITGGKLNVVNTTYGTICGGYGNLIEGNSSTICGGRDTTVLASYSFATGRDNVIEAHALGSAVFGFEVTSTSPGSINVSGRGTTGQSILLNLNNTTSNYESAVLVGRGTWTTPVIPDNAVWSGDIRITVTDAYANVTAFIVHFAATATRVATFEVEEVADEIDIAEPTLTLDDNRFLLAVAGNGVPLSWNATATVSQAILPAD